MTTYHAVMIDETGCEFGVSIKAASRADAYAKLERDYPESRCDQLESPADSRARERRMYERIERETNGDFSWGDYE